MVSLSERKAPELSVSRVQDPDAPSLTLFPQLDLPPAMDATKSSAVPGSYIPADSKPRHSLIPSCLKLQSHHQPAHQIPRLAPSQH